MGSRRASAQKVRQPCHIQYERSKAAMPRSRREAARSFHATKPRPNRKPASEPTMRTANDDFRRERRATMEADIPPHPRDLRPVSRRLNLRGQNGFTDVSIALFGCMFLPCWLSCSFAWLLGIALVIWLLVAWRKESVVGLWSVGAFGMLMLFVGTTVRLYAERLNGGKELDSFQPQSEAFRKYHRYHE